MRYVFTVIYRNPILTHRFHTNIKAVVRVKPISKTVQIRIVGRKAFLLIVRLYAVCDENNCSHRKSFADINSATNRINNFKTIFLPVKNVRKKTVTEWSHNLTGAKTILRVHAQRQHLFVIETMIPTLIIILF